MIPFYDPFESDGALPNDTGFQVGDVVQLRSGGPLMTVEHITGLNVRNRINCTWLDAKGQPQEEAFSPSMLVRR